MILAISCLVIIIIFETYRYFNIRYLFNDIISFFRKTLSIIFKSKLSDEEKLKFLKENNNIYIKILYIFTYIFINLIILILITYTLSYIGYEIKLFLSTLNLIISFIFSIIYYFIRKQYVKKL